MSLHSYNVTLTFTEPMLGTVPNTGASFEFMQTVQQAKAAKASADVDPEYLEAAQAEEAGTAQIEDAEGETKVQPVTGFHLDAEGHPCLYDYMIKGFCKDACSMLRRTQGTISSTTTSHKKIIDGLLFVKPRLIRIWIPEGEEMVRITRPLRVGGPQGERVAIASSDAVPAGSQVHFTLYMMPEKSGGPKSKVKPFDEAMLQEWFEYGFFRGLGQWRNAGWGSFTYTMEKGRILDKR